MSFQVSDLLSFDKMVTPVLIKVIYWLGVAMILLSSLLGGC
ncbi:DUF4282 domain-containing protein [Dokdonella sp.]|nr:DUF4282 domain-containing protein [Dokdonella sp.]